MRLLSIGFACLLLAAPAAHAQLFRTYLASYGKDTNPCTVDAPCRLLPAALNAVLNGGEIWMLDSANFNSGTVTIAKSVSIQAIPGQVASIMAVASTDAIQITTPVEVTLRNVTIATNVNNPGEDGVLAMGGATLTVENSVFRIRKPNGIAVRAIYASGTDTRVAVHDTVFHDSYVGIMALYGVSAEVSRSKFTNCTSAAVFVGSSGTGITTNAVIADSAFSNSMYGVWVNSSWTGAVTHVSITRSSFGNNTYGLRIMDGANGAPTSVALSNSNLSNNTYGFYMTGTGAVLQSNGHNTQTHNGSNVGSVTFVSEF